MRCLYCQKRLWNPFGSTQFCSPAHESSYLEETSGAGLRRLMEPDVSQAPPQAKPGEPGTTSAQLSGLQAALWQPSAAPQNETSPNLPVPISRRYAGENTSVTITPKSQPRPVQAPPNPVISSGAPRVQAEPILVSQPVTVGGQVGKEDVVDGRRPRVGERRAAELGLDLPLPCVRGDQVELVRPNRGALPDGTFYRHDLIGCRVEMRDGRTVGLVRDVEGTLTGSRLVVDGAEGEVLIPLVSAICTLVDPAAKRIVIDPPEGLIEANARG